jgi:beta-glucosidase
LAQFPEDFIWGAASSSHQVEGNCTNNTWSRWEQACDEQGKRRVEQESGVACDHWNRYKEDIQLLKKTGCNAYRMSLEWSKVEPSKGAFDSAALEHYKQVCQELVANGIKPVINLHHYTEPIWFADMGGFEKEENLHYFVEYCEQAFNALHEYVYLWFTFNSPNAHASKGWIAGMTPPGKKNDFQTMILVLKNLLETHVRTYQALKKLPGGQESRIGILMNIFQLDPWRPWNPLDRLYCWMGNSLVHQSIYGFFKDGVFKAWVPGKASLTYTNTAAPHSLDFIGLNYYSHNYAGNFKRFPHPQEIPVGNHDYTLYAEGLYRAIQELSDRLATPLNIPIYITENGVAAQNDADGNRLRDLFLRRYLYALSQAIIDGYNVRGYIHWALMDNFEWGAPYGEKRYGLYFVDFNTQERTLKSGAQHYLDVIAVYRDGQCPRKTIRNFLYATPYNLQLPVTSALVQNT